MHSNVLLIALLSCSVYAPISSFVHYYDNSDCLGEVMLHTTLFDTNSILNGGTSSICARNVQCANPSDPACEPEYYAAYLVAVEAESAFYIVSVNGASLRQRYNSCVPSRVYRYCFYKLKKADCICHDNEIFNI